MQTTHNNLFLDSLSPESQGKLLNLAAAVSLLPGTVLYEPGTVPDYGYLLTSGIASTITTACRIDGSD
jgi:hypothetical protein